MIQSPVGTGKSFLFFDGIVFGLYTELERKVVNANCDDADIYIIFSVADEVYMLHRNITPTKSSQSVKSKLFSYKWNKSEYQSQKGSVPLRDISNITNKLPEQVIIPDANLKDYLNPQDRKSIEFKNETDLKNQLKYLLPPREVFLNRNIFMQSSDDIFGVINSERINIFKNIFWLLDIDSIKDQLADRAKEVKWMISIKKNTDNSESSFNKYISQIQSTHQSIKENYPKYPLPESINKFLDENNFLLDKMSIGDSDLNKLQIESNIYDHINNLKSQYQDIYTQQQIIQNQLKSNQDETKTINQNLSDNIQKRDILTSQLATIDPNKLETAKNTKNIYISDRQNIQNPILQSTPIQSLSINNWNELISYINTQIQNGKDFKSQTTQIEAQKSNLESTHANIQLQIDNINKSRAQKQEYIYTNYKNKIQSQIDNYNNQLQNISHNISSKQAEKNNTESKLHNLQQDLSSQVNFYCKKFEIDCPFIWQINDKIISKTNMLVQETQKELDTINIYIWEQSTQITDINNKIIALNEILSNNQNISIGDIQNEIQAQKSDYTSAITIANQKLSDLNYTQQSQIYISQIENTNKEISQITANLKFINYQDILLSNDKINNINTQIEKLESEISKYESQINNIAQIQNQIDQIQTTINIYNQKLSDLSNIYISLNQKLSDINIQLSSVDLNAVSWYEQSISELSDNITKIQYIYEQYINDVQQLKILQDEEKILKDLVGVFGKELMLLVLQEFLPALEDEINILLNRVVDYEVRFEISDNGDKLEINIKDWHIYRDVKSLSGWQRAILRLCWIFAIARRSRNEFLFLDETINNLDADKISQVAEMIQDFTEQNNIKFYSITHSTQIQNMSIRNQVINVKSILEK